MPPVLIRSILKHVHSAALSGLISSHNPDLLCLTETWLKHTTTCTELAHCTPPNYSLLSFPRISIGLTISLKPPLAELPFLFANLSHSYRPPNTASRPLNLHRLLSSYLAPKCPYSMSIAHIQLPTTLNQTRFFLYEFNSFLSFAAITPHEFIITGDFNIYVDNSIPIILPLSFFHCSPRSTWLSMYISQLMNTITLDLVITSSYSSLSPSVSMTHISPSDHLTIFYKNGYQLHVSTTLPFYILLLPRVTTHNLEDKHLNFLNTK